MYGFKWEKIYRVLDQKWSLEVYNLLGRVIYIKLNFSKKCLIWPKRGRILWILLFPEFRGEAAVLTRFCVTFFRVLVGRQGHAYGHIGSTNLGYVHLNFVIRVSRPGGRSYRKRHCCEQRDSRFKRFYPQFESWWSIRGGHEKCKEVGLHFLETQSLPHRGYNPLPQEVSTSRKPESTCGVSYQPSAVRYQKEVIEVSFFYWLLIADCWLPIAQFPSNGKVYVD